MIASTPMWFYIDVHDKDYCFFTVPQAYGTFQLNAA